MVLVLLLCFITIDTDESHSTFWGHWSSGEGGGLTQCSVNKTHFLTLIFFCRSVIEHDSEEFASLSLLLMWHDFSFIIISKSCNPL